MIVGTPRQRCSRSKLILEGQVIEEPETGNEVKSFISNSRTSACTQVTPGAASQRSVRASTAVTSHPAFDATAANLP